MQRTVRLVRPWFSMILVASAGCGLVHVRTAGGGGTAPSPGASASPGDASAPPAAAAAAGDGDGDVAARFLAAFRGFDYHAQCPGDACGGRMPAAAGLGSIDHVNPKRYIGNPDPAWLPGWDRLPGGEDDPADDIRVWNAMTLAATRKQWRGVCDARYQALDGELRALDQSVAEQLAAARAGADRYQRVAAVIAIADQLAAAEGRDYAAVLHGAVGARDAAEVALRDEAAHELPAYAYHYLRLDPEADLAQVRPRGELASERDLFCAAVLAGAVADVEQPPHSGPFHRDLDAIVRPAVSPEASAGFDALAATTGAANQARFAAATRDAGAERASALPDGVVAVTGTVRAARVAGADLVVELADTKDTVVSYACRSTGRIGGISGDGRVTYDQACKLRTETDETVYRMTIPGAGAAAALVAGDRLEVTGRITAEHKREPRRYHRVVERALAAELLVAVSHAGARRVVLHRQR